MKNALGRNKSDQELGGHFLINVIQMLTAGRVM